MSTTLGIALGFVAGLLFTAAVVLWLMRTRMIVTHRSRRTFEETCATLEKTVTGTKGWGLPVPTFDLGARFLEKQVMPENIRKLKIYFLCNSKLASQVVGTDARMAGMLPCTLAVYELADGGAWVAGMNIPLMSRMFSGVIGRVMRQVAASEERFHAAVLGLDTSSGAEPESPRPAQPQPEDEG